MRIQLLDLFEKQESVYPQIYQEKLSLSGDVKYINYIKIDFKDCRKGDLICTPFCGKKIWVKFSDYCNPDYIYGISNFLGGEYIAGKLLEKYAIRRVNLIHLKIKDIVFYKLAGEDVLSLDDCCYHPSNLKAIKLVSDTSFSKYVGKHIASIASDSMLFARKGMFANE